MRDDKCKAGIVYHGPLDRDFIGHGAKKIPYIICNEIQQQTMYMIYLCIPEEKFLEKHYEGIQRYYGSYATVNSLACQYVHKLGMIIKHSTHELNLDDQASIKIWADHIKKSIFSYQESSETGSVHARDSNGVAVASTCVFWALWSRCS